MKSIEKPSSLQKSIPIEPQKPQAGKPAFGRMLTSPAQHLLEETLISAADETALQTLIGRKKKIDRHSSIETVVVQDKRRVRYLSRTEEVTFELQDIKKFSEGSRQARDFLILILMKLPDQALFDGQLQRRTVHFTTKELVELGLYKTPKVAKQQFDKASDTLTSIKIRGTYKTRGKNGDVSFTDTAKTLAVLFTTCTSYRGNLEVSLNEDVNWGAFVRFFTPFPYFYFKLSAKGRDLLYYIFYLAANNKAEIAKNGYFNISFRSIQSFLMLPSEIDNKFPGRLIKEPIEMAIEDIEAANAEIDSERQLTLTPYPPLDVAREMPIGRFLDEGFLQVGISGEYAKYYIEGHKRKVKQIEKTQSKKEKLQEKIAIAGALKNTKKE